ncbi:MAG: hypothetical protein EXQ95_06765 [Alphaproteobacteria bacterium]|nr:hypothetical protein [Alphaproteobacteria bacterium]
MASRPEPPRRAFRICKSIYPILDGSGAARNPGRWNRLGQRVIYAAETFAGAMLEALVHANIGRLPRDQHGAEIDLPAGLDVEEATPASLPGWDEESREISRAFGSAWWEEGRSGRRPAILLVPSIVVRRERNVLVNQDHPRFAEIAASAPQPVQWDPRLKTP